jgi:predicted dehydrogenase
VIQGVGEQRPVRVAIIGCGAIGAYLHAPSIQATPSLELVAAVDPDRSRAESLAHTFGLRRVGRTIRDVAEDVDAVVLATPPHARPGLVDEAFAHRLDCLCEKPLANTVAECDRIVAAADREGRILAAAHQYRFWPSRRWIRDEIRAPASGRLREVQVSQGQEYGWNAVTGYTVRREMVSGGVLLNAGLHTLDALLWWLGEPERLEYYDDAFGGLESNCRLRLEYPSGVAVNYRQSRTCRLANEIRLYWESGRTAITDFSSPFRVWTIESGRQSVYDLGGSALGFLAAGQALYEDFARAVRERGRPAIDGREATRVVRLIEACYEEKRHRPEPPIVPSPGLTW